MISAPGDYGKPRPAVVVQSDLIALDSVLVAQVTSTVVDAPLYRLTSRLLSESARLLASCACEAGCPSCVGPVGEVGEKGKKVAARILAELVGV